MMGIFIRVGLIVCSIGSFQCHSASPCARFDFPTLSDTVVTAAENTTISFPFTIKSDGCTSLDPARVMDLKIGPPQFETGVRRQKFDVKSGDDARPTFPVRAHTPKFARCLLRKLHPTTKLEKPKIDPDAENSDSDSVTPQSVLEESNADLSGSNLTVVVVGVNVAVFTTLTIVAVIVICVVRIKRGGATAARQSPFAAEELDSLPPSPPPCGLNLPAFPEYHPIPNVDLRPKSPHYPTLPLPRRPVTVSDDYLIPIPTPRGRVRIRSDGDTLPDSDSGRGSKLGKRRHTFSHLAVLESDV
ncbi:hypothetical protein BaRGS_00013399 [Batillaria attramentaria]|uniref:Uncharacterized protein n=1 Tax=Batillaria attramentaria TaxID=370345 RepID=A0ABD0L8G1_9CAEN